MPAGFEFPVSRVAVWRPYIPRSAGTRLTALGRLARGVTLAQALGYGSSFDPIPRDVGFLVVAAALLTGCLIDRLQRADRSVFPVIAVYTLFSLGLAVGAAGDLADGSYSRGGVDLGIVGLYCVIAALVFRRDRDLSTLTRASAPPVRTTAMTRDP